MCSALATGGCEGCSHAARSDGGLDIDSAETEDAERAEGDTGRPDRDHDGVCDETERMFRTNPDDPDSDGDGLSDRFEIDHWTSPLSATDPPASERVRIRERAGERVSVSFGLVYRGQGESVTGILFDRPGDIDGRGLTELGSVIQALEADPRAAVGALQGPMFTEVVGRVRLTWLLTIEWPAIAPLGCRRAYVGFPSVHAEGIGVVYGRRLVLDVEPETMGGSLDAGVDGAVSVGPGWAHVAGGFCVPEGPCR